MIGSSKDWTRVNPTECGLYLCRLVGQWPIRVARVDFGDWRLARDPSRLYAGNNLLDSLHADWLGPIIEPEENNGRN